MRLPSYLRQSRHGIYYLRLVLPQFLADTLGQQELIRTLDTRSSKIASISGYQVSLRIKPLFQRLQRIMAIDPNSLDPADIRKLIVDEMDFRPDGSISIKGVKTSDDPAISSAELQSLRDTATAWKKVHAFTASMTDEEFALKQAEAERLRDELLATQTPAPASAPALLPQAPSPLPPGVTVPLRPCTLRQAYDAYIASKKKISQSAKESYQESFDLFATLMGGEDRMAHELTAIEFKEFGDALAHIPSHAKKRGIKLGTAAQLLANPPALLDKHDKPIDPIAGSTANAHLTNLQSFFDYVIQSGRRNGDNPFLKLPRHSDGEMGGDGADGFDEHELKTIFDPHFFMQAKRPTQFWGPLLALYTGARLNELACLDLADFVTEKGIRCIRITTLKRAMPQTVEHQRPVRSAKQTKNKASDRLVPLHPDLYEIGIEDYIADLQSLGATRFFPNCPLDIKGKRERRLSHDGNEYLKTVGVHVMRKKVMHSFRDTVCEMLSVQDMDDVRADQWTGHKNQSIKGRHYRSKAAIDLQAKEGFDALNFDFINLERLKYRKGWWNGFIKKNMVD